jgi:hypothetical protein
VRWGLLEISEADLEALRADLGAITDRVRGKGEEGAELDTLEYTRSTSTCEDLSASPQAQKISKGFASARVDLLFEDPEVGEVRLRVSTLHGSIYFVNAVPESVIDHVFEALRRVKGF